MPRETLDSRGWDNAASAERRIYRWLASMLCCTAYWYLRYTFLSDKGISASRFLDNTFKITSAFSCETSIAKKRFLARIAAVFAV